MNILFLSAGRRGELLKDFRNSLTPGSHIIATDNSKYAPALYYADYAYLVPKIDDPSYIDTILDICKKEDIDAVTTLIDPEIMILSENRPKFSEIGVEVLAPYLETAKLAFDKYEMFKYLKEHDVPTPETFNTADEAIDAVRSRKYEFPLFVKPRRGSGSVGARKVFDEDELREAFKEDESLIAQELMTGDGCIDLDADIYVDTISHEAVSAFSKRKISTTIGGANKTISFKDSRLFEFIHSFMQYFKFNGPLDADFFYKNGKYYLSEINPRFGGAYLHAYGAGVDFVKLIENNVNGVVNKAQFGNYEENIVMLMYDTVVIGKDDGTTSTLLDSSIK